MFFFLPSFHRRCSELDVTHHLVFKSCLSNYHYGRHQMISRDLSREKKEALQGRLFNFPSLKLVLKLTFILWLSIQHETWFYWVIFFFWCLLLSLSLFYCFYRYFGFMCNTWKYNWVIERSIFLLQRKRKCKSDEIPIRWPFWRYVKTHTVYSTVLPHSISDTRWCYFTRSLTVPSGVHDDDTQCGASLAHAPMAWLERECCNVKFAKALSLLSLAQWL